MNITASKRILLILLIVPLLLVVGWLTYSFYLMQTSNGNHLTMFVDIQNQTIGKNVRSDFPQRDSSVLTYTFPVYIEKYLETDSQYSFTLSSNLYPNPSTTKNFEYQLDKETFEGESIKGLEESPVLLKINYDLTKNIRYFFEYSVCTAKKIYSDMFKLDLSCGRGNCIVQREVAGWNIQNLDVASDEKSKYFNEYDKEALMKELTYFYMTDDFGYFNPTSFRYSSTQYSRADGTFSFGSEYVNNAGDAQEISPVVFWFLSGVSNLIDLDSNLDISSYLSTIKGYINTQSMGNSHFLNCRTSSFIVSNLNNCSSAECEEVKELAVSYCKNSLEKVIEKYDVEYASVSGANDFHILQGFIFSTASEMVRFNKMVDETGLNQQKYTEEVILSYYQKGKELSETKDSVLAKCYSLDSAKEIYNQYPTDGVKIDMDSIYSSLPKIDSICNGSSSDPFCNMSIVERLVCVDSLIGYNTGEANKLMSDIFYKHYFKSPGAFKIVTYENWRFSPFSENNPKSLVKLNEYGYLTDIREKDGVINHTANMSDSYYFINLLKLLSND